MTTPGGLNFLSGLVILGLYFYLSRYGRRSSTIVWFRTFLILSAVYSFSSSLMQCSQTNAMYSLWLNVSDFSAVLLIPVSIIFTLHFTNQAHVLERESVRISLLAGAAVYLAINWTTDLIHVHDISLATSVWGYHSQVVGEWRNFGGLVYLLGYGTPVVIIARYLRHIQDAAKRKEVRIVMIAMALVVAPGLIFEGILPGIFHVPSLPAAWLSNIIVGGMVVFAITRYGLHVFSLNNVTSNIVQVMPGGLIILDHTNTIQYVNTGAAKMLGYPPASSLVARPSGSSHRPSATAPSRRRSWGTSDPINRWRDKKSSYLLSANSR